MTAFVLFALLRARGVPLRGRAHPMSAWLMLRRTLLRTALTRARRLVVLVGSKRAIAQAVRTEGAGRRYAALVERLRRGQRQGSARAGP
jgi:ATP-dependent exoDNAse (exonuclease V) alpha subunit